MPSANQRQSTFVARLHPWASKFNLKPHLSSITLANILAGDTCPPISLADFEAYLAFKEYSLESLQFVVWFQDYRERYFQVTAPEETHGLGERDFAFATPSHAEIDRRATESLARVAQHSLEPTKLTSPLPPIYTTFATTPHTLLDQPTKTNDDEETNPLSKECMRILATFIRPGAAKELTVDAVVRETLVRELSVSCHPNAFLPIYEEMFNTLERVSLPRFLASATANINLPKQFFWYGIGFIDLSISIAIAASLIFMLPTPPESNRAWRLFAVPFACFGSMQFYSAWRGFCNQVWMRGGTQLRVWELQEMDEESRMYADKVLQPRQIAELSPGLGHLCASPGGSYMHKDDDDASSGVYPTPILSADPAQDLSAIAPFSCAVAAGADAERNKHRSTLLPPYAATTTASSSRSAFMRPPIFGPERVVMDPRIKAVHQQVMSDILRVGFWYTLAFCVIIFTIPGCGPRPRS